MASQTISKPQDGTPPTEIQIPLKKGTVNVKKPSSSSSAGRKRARTMPLLEIKEAVLVMDGRNDTGRRRGIDRESSVTRDDFHPLKYWKL